MVKRILGGNALLVAATFALANASPAAAQLLPIVSCTGTHTVTQTPGVTNVPQDVETTFDTDFTVCVHAAVRPHC